MSERLALHGGTPVRSSMLPYGQQTIGPEDEAAVLGALRSGWLTTGPAVPRFEQSFARYVGASEAVAVANGTAALHAAYAALGIGPGDTVLVPAITFAATANCVVHAGARPVFVDVDADTLLIDPASAWERLTPSTGAIAAVDFGGQPAPYGQLAEIAVPRGVHIVADAAHALGATLAGGRVGTLADLSTFSLHPVKHVTAGEGGVITTENVELAERMRRFRNHGISRDFRAREAEATWEYEIAELGWNYRITDLQCALAEAQLGRVDAWLARRREIAAAYTLAFADLPGVTPLAVRPDAGHAWHLYVIRLDAELIRADRRTVFRALRAEGIGVNVHYMPIHLHPYYRKHFGTVPGECPVAEAMYERILTLPLFPAMSEADVQDVVTAVRKVTTGL